MQILVVIMCKTYTSKYLSVFLDCNGVSDGHTPMDCFEYSYSGDNIIDVLVDMLNKYALQKNIMY